MSQQETWILKADAKNKTYKIVGTVYRESDSRTLYYGITTQEDISHQLKTPLTSITILIDNIIDNPDMDKETRREFAKDIKFVSKTKQN